MFVIKNNYLYRAIIQDTTEIAESRYETYTNKLTSILRLAEKAHYNKLLREKRGSSKETWMILNTVIHKERQSLI